jgi:hypothetical protein
MRLSEFFRNFQNILRTLAPISRTLVTPREERRHDTKKRGFED